MTQPVTYGEINGHDPAATNIQATIKLVRDP
jgi:hypothetical protein